MQSLENFSKTCAHVVKFQLQLHVYEFIVSSAYFGAAVFFNLKKKEKDGGLLERHTQVDINRKGIVIQRAVQLRAYLM